MRNTKQRDLILSVVRDSCDHPTAETVYERARALMPTISLGTVYRNLAQLVEIGQVRKIATAHGGDRFDKTVRVHAHFHCYSCNQVIDVGDKHVEELISLIEKEEGNTVSDSEILFVGKCKNCSAKLSD